MLVLKAHRSFQVLNRDLLSRLLPVPLDLVGLVTVHHQSQTCRLEINEKWVLETCRFPSDVWEHL